MAGIYGNIYYVRLPRPTFPTSSTQDQHTNLFCMYFLPQAATTASPAPLPQNKHQDSLYSLSRGIPIGAVLLDAGSHGRDTQTPSKQFTAKAKCTYAFSCFHMRRYA
jgi:hypothetical protein